MAQREVAVRFPVVHEGNAEEVRALEDRRYGELLLSLRIGPAK